MDTLRGKGKNHMLPPGPQAHRMKISGGDIFMPKAQIGGAFPLISCFLEHYLFSMRNLFLVG